MSYITRTPDHHYEFEGVTYPGVTGVLKVLDKSGPLMAWASRMTAEAAITLHDSIPLILSTSGRDGAIQALTARSGWQRDEAASLGSQVHAIADQIHRGIETDYHGPGEAKVRQYLEWYERANWRVRATEAFVINPEAGYGGTLDLLAYDGDGRTVLADLKTGRAVYRETALQLAAYGRAKFLDPQDGLLYAMPEIDRYVVLHVTDDGVREIEMAVGSDEWAAFKACIVLARWTAAAKGRSDD